MQSGVIYLVPVPIGNLRDITLRALDVFGSVPLIACEDTRKTAFLLSQHSLKIPKLISFHKFNERSREELLFEHISSGQDLAIASDAGSPTISDPALAFIKKAILRDIKIIALPGATALIPALSVSGLGEGLFQFIGFLPAKNKARQEILQSLKSYPHPTVIYESVHHLKDTLHALYAALGDRRISISREISKLHEECIRGSLQEITEDFDITLKGEFVIVLDGAAPAKASFPSKEADGFILEHSHLKTKALAALLAKRYAIGKNEAYAYLSQKED